MQIVLNAVDKNEFNQFGIGTLTEENGQVRVVLDLNKVSGTNNSQPAHIHIGSCPGVGAILFPLNNVVNGRSESVINANLNDLRSQAPIAINIHKSISEVAVYTACGNIR